MNSVVADGQATRVGGRKHGRQEANRDRLERFRLDVTRAAVEAFEVIQQARPDALTLFGDHDVIRERVRTLYEREHEAGRLLMAVSIGYPGSEAAVIAEAAEELRRRLRVTTGLSSHFAAKVIGRGDHPEFARAQEANDNAREGLEALKQALRNL